MNRTLLLLIATLSVAACATQSPGLGRNVHAAGTTALPSGLRLLGSEEESCEGALQIGTVSGIVVQPGENAAFPVVTPDIVWNCQVPSRHGETACPHGTTHVRVTRAAVGREFLMECYGV